MNNAHSHPFGSARFAKEREALRAFRKPGGVPIGFVPGRKLYHSSNAGALLIGGAGSGKFTTMLSHIMDAPGVGGAPARFAILDPKGEMATVVGAGLVHLGAHVYYVNPYGLHGLPNHRLSLFSHLTPGSPSLVADSRRAARVWLPESGGGDSRFFEQKAQNWFDPVLRGLVHADRGVSPMSLFELLGMVRAAPEAWAQAAEAMAALGEADLGIAYTEMQEMAAESRRTYDSVLSEISNALAVMSDPALQETFVSTDQADFTLDVLTEDSKRPVYVFLIMPDELIAQNAAIIRQFFSTLRTLKQRKPQAPCVRLVIDEAARLGRFPEIAEFYSIGRGMAVSPFCVYQAISQITQNLGDHGARILSASADAEIYLGGGISDLETAEHLSRQLGQQTLSLDDHLIRERAARAKREAVHAMLHEGADPFKTGMSLRALDYELTHVRKQARPLMSADEILNMPRDKALIWASGYGIRPFLVDKVPYYALRRHAGRYFPNPYFDRDLERVRVRTRFGYRTRRVICEAVPEPFKDFPQYQSGEWRFIEGYRPKLKRRK